MFGMFSAPMQHTVVCVGDQSLSILSGYQFPPNIYIVVELKPPCVTGTGCYALSQVESDPNSNVLPG